MVTLQVQVQEQLTPVEKLSMAPFWSTFCGTSNGAWQGVQAAFSPVTGMSAGLPCALRLQCSAGVINDISVLDTVLWHLS